MSWTFEKAKFKVGWTFEKARFKVGWTFEKARFKVGWTFEKARFKVGDRVRFPYGRKVGTIKRVGSQVYEGKWLGHLYQVTT